MFIYKTLKSKLRGESRNGDIEFQSENMAAESNRSKSKSSYKHIESRYQQKPKTVTVNRTSTLLEGNSDEKKVAVKVKVPSNEVFTKLDRRTRNSVTQETTSNIRSNTVSKTVTTKIVTPALTEGARKKVHQKKQESKSVFPVSKTLVSHETKFDKEYKVPKNMNGVKNETKTNGSNMEKEKGETFVNSSKKNMENPEKVLFTIGDCQPTEKKKMKPRDRRNNTVKAPNTSPSLPPPPPPPPERETLDYSDEKMVVSRDSTISSRIPVRSPLANEKISKTAKKEDQFDTKTVCYNYNAQQLQFKTCTKVGDRMTIKALRGARMFNMALCAVEDAKLNVSKDVQEKKDQHIMDRYSSSNGTNYTKGRKQGNEKKEILTRFTDRDLNGVFGNQESGSCSPDINTDASPNDVKEEELHKMNSLVKKHNVEKFIHETLKEHDLTEADSIRVWQYCMNEVRKMLEEDSKTSKGNRGSIRSLNENWSLKEHSNEIKKVAIIDKSKRKRRVLRQEPKRDPLLLHQSKSDLSNGFLRFILPASQARLLIDLSSQCNRNNRPRYKNKAKQKTSTKSDVQKKSQKEKKKRQKLKKLMIREREERFIQSQPQISENIENQPGNELTSNNDNSVEVNYLAECDERTPSKSPANTKLEKLKVELEQLRRNWQSQYQTKASFRSQYTAYDANKTPDHVMILKESAKESLYNFNSYLHQFIESSSMFNQKTHDVMSSLFEDDDNFYERLLTTEAGCLDTDEKLISPVDYPSKSKKIGNSSDDILKLQVMLSDAFGNDEDAKAPRESPDITPLKDMIFSSPNIGLSGLDCSFTSSLCERRKVNADTSENNSNSNDLVIPTANQLVNSENMSVIPPVQQDERASPVQISTKQQTEKGVLQDNLSSVDDNNPVIASDNNKQEDIIPNEIPEQTYKMQVCQPYSTDVVKPQEQISIKAVIRQNKELRRKKTKFGFTFQDCAKLYQQNQPLKSRRSCTGRHVDFIACDTSCYEDFQNVLKPILSELHYGKELSGGVYGLDKKSLRKLMSDNPCYSNIVQCVLEIRRSFHDSVFPVACENRKEKQRNERLLRTACKVLNERFNGQTVPLSFTDEDIQELLRQDILAHEMDSTTLCHSSIYKSDHGNVLVLLNFKEHVHVITKCPQMDFKKLFADADHVITKIDQNLKLKGYSFAWDTNLGYLNPGPSNLGLALTLTVRITLSNLNKISELDRILNNYGVEITRKMYDNSLNDYIYNFRNRYQFGVTELDIVRTMKSVTCLLCEINDRIETNRSYEDLLEREISRDTGISKEK